MSDKNILVVVVVAVVLLFVVALAAYFIGFGHGFKKAIEPPVPPGPGGIACTMDAKLCPDGSAVGRTGPKCEFAPCPGEEPPNVLPPKQGSGIRGSVILGPICPVMMDPPDPKCADRPFETKLAVTVPDGSRVIKEFYSNALGTFSVSVPPGKYAIRWAVAANVLPYCRVDGNEEGQVQVLANKFSEIIVHCDTGIR